MFGISPPLEDFGLVNKVPAQDDMLDEFEASFAVGKKKHSKHFHHKKFQAGSVTVPVKKKSLKRPRANV